MNSKTPDDEAGRVRRLLQGLPPRRAPASLEARVRRQLESRFATSVGRAPAHRGFRSWPGWARAGFVTLTAVLVAYSALDLPWRLAARPLQTASTFATGWLHPALALAASVNALTHGLVRWVPPAWLAGIAGMVIVFYAVLFALGAAAYRTLYLQSPRLGDLA